MADKSFDQRLTLVEINSILLNNGLADEASKLMLASKSLAKGDVLSEKELSRHKVSMKDLNTIRSMQRTLLDSLPGFLMLDPVRKAALLYLTSRIGYAGVTRNTKLWDCLKDKDFEGASKEIDTIDYLKKEQRETISELIRSGNVQ